MEQIKTTDGKKSIKNELRSIELEKVNLEYAESEHQTKSTSKENSCKALTAYGQMETAYFCLVKIHDLMSCHYPSEYNEFSVTLGYNNWLIVRNLTSAIIQGVFGDNPIDHTPCLKSLPFLCSWAKQIWATSMSEDTEDTVGNALMDLKQSEQDLIKDCMQVTSILITEISEGVKLEDLVSDKILCRELIISHLKKILVKERLTEIDTFSKLIDEKRRVARRLPISSGKSRKPGGGRKKKS